MIIIVDKTIDFRKIVEEVKKAVPRTGRISLSDVELRLETQDEIPFTHEETQAIRTAVIAHDGDKIKKQKQNLIEELGRLRGIKDTESMSPIDRIRRLEKLIAGENAI